MIFNDPLNENLRTHIVPAGEVFFQHGDARFATASAANASSGPAMAKFLSRNCSEPSVDDNFETVHRWNINVMI